MPRTNFTHSQSDPNYLFADYHAATLNLPTNINGSTFSIRIVWDGGLQVGRTDFNAAGGSNWNVYDTCRSFQDVQNNGLPTTFLQVAEGVNHQMAASHRPRGITVLYGFQDSRSPGQLLIRTNRVNPHVALDRQDVVLDWRIVQVEEEVVNKFGFPLAFTQKFQEDSESL